MVSQKVQKAQEFEKGRRSPQERKSRAGVVRKNAQEVPPAGVSGAIRGPCAGARLRRIAAQKPPDCSSELVLNM